MPPSFRTASGPFGRSSNTLARWCCKVHRCNRSLRRDRRLGVDTISDEARSAVPNVSVGGRRQVDIPVPTSRDARLVGMAFGQQSGPPAAANRVRELLALLQDAGHTDFRDARGPMGFTQRQAGGKFTRDEADAFIEQLEEAAHDESPPPPHTRAIRTSAAERALRDVSAELLAAELQRRGWIVIEP